MAENDDSKDSNEFDETTRRLLREAEMLSVVPGLLEAAHADFREQLETTEKSKDMVDMRPLLQFFAANGIDTTWSAGGIKQGTFSLDLPRIMFPHLNDLERVLELFETLARSIGDEDIVDAIYKHLGDVGIVYDGEKLLHGEQSGVKTKSGRIVSLDHSWAVEVSSLEYEHWVSALQNFGRVVPDRKPIGERMWRFTVHMPVGHAERLNRAAAAAAG